MCGPTQRVEVEHMQLRRTDVRLPQAAGNLMSWLQGIRREQSGMIERRANNQDRGSQPVAAVGPMHMRSSAGCLASPRCAAIPPAKTAVSVSPGDPGENAAAKV